MTKNGTPLAPRAEARASSARTSAPKASPDRVRPTSIGSRPTSTASSERVAGSPTDRPSVKYAASSRSFMASPRPWVSARWISRWASKVLPGRARSRWYSRPTSAGQRGHPAVGRPGLLHGHPVLALEDPVHAQTHLAGRRRVELVAPPRHGHPVGMGEPAAGPPRIAACPRSTMGRPRPTRSPRPCPYLCFALDSLVAHRSSVQPTPLSRPVQPSRGPGIPAHSPVSSAHGPRARPDRSAARGRRGVRGGTTGGPGGHRRCPRLPSRSEAHRGVEAPERYLLLVEWDTLDDHPVGFRQSEAFTRGGPSSGRSSSHHPRWCTSILRTARPDGSGAVGAGGDLGALGPPGHR